MKGCLKNRNISVKLGGFHNFRELSKGISEHRYPYIYSMIHKLKHKLKPNEEPDSIHQEQCSEFQTICRGKNENGLLHKRVDNV